MKSPSVITTNTKESFTNLSSDSDQVYNCSNIENSTEQNCMILPSKITSIVNVSSTKLSSVTGQVSNSTIANNKIEKKCMESPSEITMNTKESLTNLPSDSDQVSNSSTSKNSTEQNCMKNYLLKSLQLSMYHQPNYLLLPVKFPILQLQIIKLNKTVWTHHLKSL